MSSAAWEASPACRSLDPEIALPKDGKWLQLQRNTVAVIAIKTANKL